MSDDLSTIPVTTTPQPVGVQSKPDETKPKKPETPPGAVSGPSKEIIGSIGPSFGEIVKPEESRIEIELPKEIERVGVKAVPQSVKIPKNLERVGVKPAGDNVQLGTGKSIQLPLTDTQIVEGLKSSVGDSLRWLAEWCRKKLLAIANKKP